MAVDASTPLDGKHLQEAIERHIAQLCGTLVQNLHVDALPDRVVIRGHTRSYYLKQLALRSALHVCRLNNAFPVELQVEVDSDSRA